MNHLLIFHLEKEKIQKFLVFSEFIDYEREFALVEVFGDDALSHAIFNIEDVVSDLEGNAYEVHALGNESSSFLI